MAIYHSNDRYEFDLTIKHYGDKDRRIDPYMGGYPRQEEKPEEELKESLTFNSRTATEVVRKLLDYLER